jgi:hypothetical protein
MLKQPSVGTLKQPSSGTLKQPSSGTLKIKRLERHIIYNLECDILEILN